MAVLGLSILTTWWSWISFGFMTILLYVIFKVTMAYIDYCTWVHLYNDLPGDPSPSRLWGHLLNYPGPNEEGLKFHMEHCDRYPLFHLLWISFRPVLILHHPDTVKELLKSTEPKPRQIGTVYILGLDWLGEGLLIANGEKWARNRRLLTPAFHFDILQSYIALKNKAASVLVIDAKKTPWFYSDFLFSLSASGREFKKNCDYVHKVAENIIEKRRKSLKEDGPNPKTRHLDFLDILLTAKDENDKGLTSLEIRNEVDTFLFEGHDTTTSAMCWTLYLLAKHPEHQDLCQREIDKLLKDRDNKDLEWTDLSKLSYLTQCIKESMRLYPPVTFIQRVTTKETVLHGHPIPIGTTMGIPIYNLHHNKAVWEDPYDFRPNRFSPDSEKNDSFAFVPFSAGPRNCIGQHFAMNEMKIILVHILQRYELSLDPDHEVNIKIGVVLRTKNGIKVQARRRDV
ncbi:cytochrome P450 4F12-like [Saccostrea cucullata]|uniref:cytochrome P450 4F12-like n=1 Tax=Saccostrea cuccullata TaxID=36930 RepID=UPI002ED647FC